MRFRHALLQTAKSRISAEAPPASSSKTISVARSAGRQIRANQPPQAVQRRLVLVFSLYQITISLRHLCFGLIDVELCQRSQIERQFIVLIGF